MQAVTEAVEKHLRVLDLQEVVGKQANNLLVADFRYASDRARLIREALSGVIREKLVVDVSLKEDVSEKGD
jgi:hypothetical protein